MRSVWTHKLTIYFKRHCTTELNLFSLFVIELHVGKDAVNSSSHVLIILYVLEAGFIFVHNNRHIPDSRAYYEWESIIYVWSQQFSSEMLCSMAVSGKQTSATVYLSNVTEYFNHNKMELLPKLKTILFLIHFEEIIFSLFSFYFKVFGEKKIRKEVIWRIHSLTFQPVNNLNSLCFDFYAVSS